MKSANGQALQSVQSVGAVAPIPGAGAEGHRPGHCARRQGDDRAGSGVGPKLATRTVTELKDKAPSVILRQDREAISPLPPADRGMPFWR
jgi:Holliday junction DNA helicase RuvA